MVTDSHLIRESIRRARWFHELPEEARNWLADACRMRDFSRGDSLCRRGESLTQLYGVVHGVVRCYVIAANGDECTIADTGPDEWLPHFVPGPSPRHLANFRAYTDVRLAVLDFAKLEVCATHWPQLYRSLYADLSDRIVGGLGRVELLSSHDLNTRLAVCLLVLIRRQLQLAPSEPPVLQVTQSELAQRIGSTRPRVNVRLNDWAQRGLVEIGSGQVRILDGAALKAEAQRTGFDFDAYY